mmetsp:Transcript_73097/g.169484  ORF Transcript_73097/g.169484 Transcript_73097/m.169484 type:complete len:96 (-) Transcript_73097:475-762(-)
MSRSKGARSPLRAVPWHRPGMVGHSKVLSEVGVARTLPKKWHLEQQHPGLHTEAQHRSVPSMNRTETMLLHPRHIIRSVFSWACHSQMPLSLGVA